MNLPDKKTLALQTLKEAQSYLGVSRANNPDQVGHFLGIYGLPFAENGTPVPFCDAGLGFCACKALALANGEDLTPDNIVNVLQGYLPAVRANYFYASPSCGQTVEHAKEAGMWIDAGEAGNNLSLCPGWLVLYDWNEDGAADHVGMIQTDEGDFVQDVEFNTSAVNQADGGAVAIRTRNWNAILGFVRTY